MSDEMQDKNSQKSISDMTPQEVRNQFDETFGPFEGIDDNVRYLFAALYICLAYGADNGLFLEFRMLLGFYKAQYRFHTDNKVLTFALCNTAEEACARLTLMARLALAALRDRDVNGGGNGN